MSKKTEKDLIKLSKRKLIKMLFVQTELGENQRQQINNQQKLIQNLELLVKELHREIQSLKKDSSNSSKPPSLDDNFSVKKNQSLRQKSDKKTGGQIGHQGTTRKQIKRPDKIVSCRPNKCSHCGEDLSDLQGKVISRRQQADIPPIEPCITEFQQEEIRCSCGHPNKGEFPDYIKSPFQLGQNLKSFIVYLNTAHYIPYKRLSQLVDDLLNIHISEGTIDNTLDYFYSQGIPIYNSILTDIKQQKWTGSDETGTKVNGKNWWQWVWQNKVGSFYAIEPSRGYQVVEKYFGSNYIGTLIHDCWSAQNNTVADGHQLCHPHLLRDLIFCMEVEKSKWAYNMKQLLLASEKARDIIWQADFNHALRTRIILEYQDKLEQLINQAISGKETTRLQKRFKKHQTKIFYFMHDPDTPWHNNSSEQAIRNSKLHQKISGCFRSIKGAKRRSVILSIIETCKKRNLNILDSLQRIYQGQFSFVVAE